MFRGKRVEGDPETGNRQEATQGQDSDEELGPGPNRYKDLGPGTRREEQRGRAPGSALLCSAAACAAWWDAAQVPQDDGRWFVGHGSTATTGEVFGLGAVVVRGRGVGCELLCGTFVRGVLCWLCRPMRTGLLDRQWMGRKS